jgi:hypothetical protein
MGLLSGITSSISKAVSSAVSTVSKAVTSIAAPKPSPPAVVSTPPKPAPVVVSKPVSSPPTQSATSKSSSGNTTVQNIVNSPINPLNILSAIESHPVAFVSSLLPGGTTPQQVVQQTISEGAGKTITRTVANTATVATGVLTAGSSLTTGLAMATLKTVTTGAITAGVIQTAGGAIGNSSKLQTAVATVNPAKFGEDIGTVIENPSIEAAKKLAVDNPLLLGAVAAGATYIAGSNAVNLIASYETKQNTKAVEQNTTATTNTLQQTKPVAAAEAALPVNSITGAPMATLTPAPVVSKKTTKKKKKKKKVVAKKHKVYKKHKTTKHKKKKKKR